MKNDKRPFANHPDTASDAVGRGESMDYDPSLERRLPLVVLGEMVIMPHMTIPLQVPQGKSYRAMERAWDEEHREVLLIFVRESELEGYKSSQPQQLPPIGVIARLDEFAKLPDGTARVILEGLYRARIFEAVQISPFYRVRCVPVFDPDLDSMEVQALMDTVKQQVDEFVDHLAKCPRRPCSLCIASSGPAIWPTSSPGGRPLISRIAWRCSTLWIQPNGSAVPTWCWPGSSSC